MSSANEIANRTVRSWMKVHSQCVTEIIKRMIGVGVPLARLKQLFAEGDDEEFITYEGIGYHIEKDLNVTENHLEVRAVPGCFVTASTGMRWVDRRCRLHDEIEKKYDQKETSLIIQ